MRGKPLLASHPHSAWLQSTFSTFSLFQGSNPPRSQYRSVCFRERPCTQHAHAEHLSGKNKLGALKTSFSMLCSLHIPSHKQIAGHIQPPFAYRDTVVLISLIHYLLWFTCSHRSAHLGLAHLPDGSQVRGSLWCWCSLQNECNQNGLTWAMKTIIRVILVLSSMNPWLQRVSLFLQTLVLHESLL